ncbi:hypothetical protein NUSPORA_00793 [Nucleospora cyclopteri]
MFIIKNFFVKVYTTVTTNKYNSFEKNSSNDGTNCFSLEQIIFEPNIVEYHQDDSILPILDSVEINSFFEETILDSNILYNQQSGNIKPFLSNNTITELDSQNQSLIKTDIIEDNVFCENENYLETQIKIFENILKSYQNDDPHNLKSTDSKKEAINLLKHQKELSNDELLLLTETHIKNNSIEEPKIESTIKHSNSNPENKTKPMIQNSDIEEKILDITQKCIHLLMQQINLLNPLQVNINKVEVISSQVYSLMINQQDLQEKCFNKNIEASKSHTLCSAYPNFQQHFSEEEIQSFYFDKVNDKKIILENPMFPNTFSNFSTTDLTSIENSPENVAKYDEKSIEKPPIIQENTSNLFESNIEFANYSTKNDIHKAENINNQTSFRNKAINLTFIEDHTYSSLHKTNPKENIMEYKYISNPQIHQPTQENDFQTFTDIETTHMKPNVNKKTQIYNINYGSLSSGECDDDKTNSSDSEDKDVEFESFSSYTFKKKLFGNETCIKVHKNSNEVLFFIAQLDFTKEKLTQAINDRPLLPSKFSFSPGWRHFHLVDLITYKRKIDNLNIQNVSKEYELQEYTSIIYNMIRINTYSRSNKNLSFILLFKLFCYNLCSKWDLGRGKNIKVNKSTKYHRLINNKNFDKLFKTKTYWQNKAKVLYENGKTRAFEEFGITISSFNAFHLYNLLLLIPLKNSKTISFVCYVFHATEANELDTNLKFVSEENFDTVINKRRKMLSICHEYQKYINNARIIYYSKSKIFEVVS